MEEKLKDLIVYETGKIRKKPYLKTIHLNIKI